MIQGKVCAHRCALLRPHDGMLNRSASFLIAAFIGISSLSQAQSSQGYSGVDTQQQGIDCNDPVNASAPACQTVYGQNTQQQSGYPTTQRYPGSSSPQTGANG